MQVQMSDFVPFLSWIRTYNRRHIKADLVAGLTVAVVAPIASAESLVDALAAHATDLAATLTEQGLPVLRPSERRNGVSRGRSEAGA